MNKVKAYCNSPLRVNKHQIVISTPQQKGTKINSIPLQREL